MDAQRDARRMEERMRLNRLVAAAATALGLAALAGPAAAHHAIGGQYDLAKTGTLKGVLTKVDWSNPHAWFHFDVKASDGSVKKWSTESMAPAGLRRLGFEDSSAFVVGGSFTVEYFPDRSGGTLGFVRAVTFPDGKLVVFRGPAAGEAPPLAAPIAAPAPAAPARPVATTASIAPAVPAAPPAADRSALLELLRPKTDN